MVFLLDPLRKKITSAVDEIIFQSPDFRITLNGIEEAIVEARTVKDLSARLTEKLKQIWPIEHSGFAVWNFKSSYFQLFPEQEFSNSIISKLQASILKTDFLVRTLESERRLFWQGVIIEDEVTHFGNKSFPGERITFWKIRRTMRWLGAAACIPLMWNKDILGFIILGPQKSKIVYNNEDKKILSHLAEKISLAIKNLQATEQNFHTT